MGSRLLLILVLLTIPAAADTGLFNQIHVKDAVTLVLPDGPCDAKVIRREPGQLTVSLKITTRTCGKRKSLFTVSGSDVQDIVDRRSIVPRPDTSGSGQCLGKLMLGPLLAGRGVMEATQSEPPGLLVMVVGGIIVAVYCHEPRRPRYGIFTDRIVPAQP
jgi:hypothetical protein